MEALVSKSCPFKSHKLLVPVSKSSEGALSIDPIKRGALRVCAIIKSDTHMRMFTCSVGVTYIHEDVLDQMKLN